MRPVLLQFLALFLGLFANGACNNASFSRPAVVNIGAIFTYNSTIGRVARVAINAAVDDVNSHPTVLAGTKLVVKMQDSDCNAFLGMIGGINLLGQFVKVKKKPPKF